MVGAICQFFFSSRRRHTRFDCDWSSDVCSSDLMCIDKIIAKARKLAAHLLDTKEKNIGFRDGKFFAKAKPKKALTWKQLAPEAYVAKNIPEKWEPGLEASSFFEPPNCTYPFGAHIVAVEVDRDTGEVKIVKYVGS